MIKILLSLSILVIVISLATILPNNHVKQTETNDTLRHSNTIQSMHIESLQKEINYCRHVLYVNNL